MTAPPPAWKAWTAWIAAYVLVLQMLVAGMAMGVRAAPLMGEGGDAVLCLSAASEDAPKPDGGGAGHAGLPNCCILGCAMFGAAAVPPVPGWSIAPQPVARLQTAAPASIVVLRPTTHGPSPSLARAPPAAA